MTPCKPLYVFLKVVAVDQMASTAALLHARLASSGDCDTTNQSARRSTWAMLGLPDIV